METHLDRRLERNARHGSVLSDGFREVGVLSDPAASDGVARWAYSQVEWIGSRVRLQGKTLVALPGGWGRLFLSPSSF
jgi:hypothetical protein